MKAWVVCLIAVAGCGSSGGAAGAFAGTWNYDQPDRTSGRNIAKVICPSPGGTLIVPQIGNIIIHQTGKTTFQGTTDQNCTWSFTSNGASASLDPPGQTCFNHFINSSYTLDWSMSIDGEAETEVITGISHQPIGECAFELAIGSRTRTDPASATDPTTAFVGTWSYDAPDATTAVNIAQVSCGAAPSFVPVSGTLSITKTGERRIAAASDGCTWTFAVAGNTAELSPASQSCGGAQLAAGLWTLATSDGHHMAESMSAQQHQSAGDCRILRSVGSLTRQ